MKFRHVLCALAAALAAMVCSVRSNAQFKNEAFTQSYVDPNDSTAVSDTTDKLFSFPEYFGGLAHKNRIKVGTMFVGSLVLPGTAQIYNRDYWKLPVIYGGMGAFAGVGGYYLHQYTKSNKAYLGWENERSAWLEANPGGNFDTPAPVLDLHAKKVGTWMMVGLGAVYWGSLLDGVACYDRSRHPLPGRATIYSLLLPGLGQAYNGEYWKIPVYYAGLTFAGYMLYTNNAQYQRYKRMHNEAGKPGYSGPYNENQAKTMRDSFRRLRDYAIVGTALVYLLQVIDANVFAYMHDFEVNDDISLEISPAVIAPDNSFALAPSPSLSNNAYGVSIGLRF